MNNLYVQVTEIPAAGKRSSFKGTLVTAYMDNLGAPHAIVRNAETMEPVDVHLNDKTHLRLLTQRLPQPVDWRINVSDSHLDATWSGDVIAIITPAGLPPSFGTLYMVKRDDEPFIELAWQGQKMRIALFPTAEQDPPSSENEVTALRGLVHDLAARFMVRQDDGTFLGPTNRIRDAAIARRVNAMLELNL